MRQSRKVVCKVIINVLFISIQNRRCRNYLTMKTCDSVQWMKRFTNSHSAYVAKNYIRFSTYVLKCHNTEEVILLYAKRFEIWNLEFVIKESVRLSKEYSLCPTLPFGIVACTFVLFSHNLSRNSCIYLQPAKGTPFRQSLTPCSPL